MTIADTPRETRQPCLPTDQELSLGDQIKFLVYGHNLDDVAGCAIGLVMNCVALKADDRSDALRILDSLYIEMRKAIARDYDEMVATADQAREQ
jgi:hypothetical protein